MKRRVAVVAVATGMALAMTEPAAARIVEGQSIAGVTLGDSMAKVRRLLGRPSQSNPCGRGCTNWAYDAPFSGVVNFGAGRTVAGMFTYSKQQKTSRGIGKGSSEAAIKRAYPSARCGTGPYGSRSRICTVRGRFKGRATETAFPMFSPREGVKEVNVYFVTGRGA